jgi:hypothetical protein
MLEKVTTSKLLMWLITALFIASYIATFVLRKYGIETKDIVRDLLLPLESIIVISYYGKSATENVIKIKSAPSSLQIDNGNMSIETVSEEPTMPAVDTAIEQPVVPGER